MKHNNKNLVLILVLVIIFVFTGCSSIRLRTFKDTDEPNNNIENNDDMAHIDDTFATDDDKEVAEESSNDDISNNDEPTPTVIQPIENTELLIYSVDSSSELDPVIALVPADKEITPELIVDTVVDSMADQSLIIGIENVSTENDTVIVSFYSDQPPLRNVGSGFEEAILNAIAQSLMDNLEDYHKVIYRVEGGPYASGHIELGLDEVYFSD